MIDAIAENHPAIDVKKAWKQAVEVASQLSFLQLKVKGNGVNYDSDRVHWSAYLSDKSTAGSVMEARIYDKRKGEARIVQDTLLTLGIVANRNDLCTEFKKGGRLGSSHWRITIDTGKIDAVALNRLTPPFTRQW